MMKTAILGSVLLSMAFSAYVTDLDNNLIEYDPEDVQPMQTISLPYPYRGSHNSHVLIRPAPIYSEPITQSNVIVAPSTELLSPGLIYTAVSCAFTAAKSIIVFLLTKAPALVAGTIIALGICKLTSLCGSEITIVEAQRELRSIATPERMARATTFVKEAVKKYSEMQNA